MSDLFWLADEQMARPQPFFLRSHGRPRADNRRLLSGIIFINRNGLRWQDAPREYGPAKTLYNHGKRWSDKDVFVAMVDGLSVKGAERKTIMIDATYLRARRTASSLGGKKGGGMNTKLHAVTDAMGRPISFFMTAGQVSDYTGAAALLDGLPKAEWLLGDRGYDADWFRNALEKKWITPCILGRKSRTKPVKYDKRRYKSRNRIESCSVTSKTGGASQHATTGARPSSWPPSLSPQPSCSGYEP